LILFIEIILIESKFIGTLKLNAINRKKFIVYLNIIVFLKKKGYIKIKKIEFIQ